MVSRLPLNFNYKLTSPTLTEDLDSCYKILMHKADVPNLSIWAAKLCWVENQPRRHFFFALQKILPCLHFNRVQSWIVHFWHRGTTIFKTSFYLLWKFFYLLWKLSTLMEIAKIPKKKTPNPTSAAADAPTIPDS